MFFQLIRLPSLSAATAVVLGLMAVNIKTAVSLPPPEEIPEEVLDGNYYSSAIAY